MRPHLALLVAAAVFPVTATAAVATVDRCGAGSKIFNGTGLPDCATRTAAGPTSVAECCTACAADPEMQCVAWTFNEDHHPPVCYLKLSTDCAHVPNADATTGILGPPPPPPPPSPAPHPTPTGAKNVLFIAVDDMRPNIGAYNYSLAHTPNLDALAAEGLRFDHAYVNYAYCSPSRNSFMTGRRPDETRVWEFVDHFREKGVGADWISMPQFFKTNGYLTLGGGKLFHPSSATENVGMADNDWPASWSPAYAYFENQPPNDPHNCRNAGDMTQTWCVANVTKESSALSDQKIRDNCIDHLRLAANLTKNGSHFSNFFVGCGFHKPHVPWVAPAEFFDLIPGPPAAEYPLAARTWAPVGMPEAAWHPPADVHGMDETPSFNGTCNLTRARTYRRAYDAAVAYQDYNIGQVLAELEALGHKNDTVVVVLGDHGWQLGDYNTWAKMSNFELALHIPLIIRAPWIPTAVGQATKAFAEAVDLYPTLAALANLPPPETQGQALNGTSLLPVFLNPGDGGGVKDAAFAQFAKISNLSVNPHFQRNETNLMGYTVRVSDWRYTAWFKFDNVSIVPLTGPGPGHDLGRELYDHRGDTGLWLDWPGEHVNLAADPQYADVVAQLHQRVLDYIQLRPVTTTDDTARTPPPLPPRGVGLAGGDTGN